MAFCWKVTVNKKGFLLETVYSEPELTAVFQLDAITLHNQTQILTRSLKQDDFPLFKHTLHHLVSASIKGLEALLTRTILSTVPLNHFWPDVVFALVKKSCFYSLCLLCQELFGSNSSFGKQKKKKSWTSYPSSAQFQMLRLLRKNSCISLFNNAQDTWVYIRVVVVCNGNHSGVTEHLPSVDLV